MFTEERTSEIEKILHQDGKVLVKELSEHFHVTDDCIRKDLKNLENKGRLKRTYGGAILSQDYPLDRAVIDRRDFHIDQKRIIAKKAVEMIQEKETVFLDISTTNIELAKEISALKKEITVVTNMLDILEILMLNKRITLIGTGGTMHSEVNGFMGIATAQAIKNYSFDKAFLGTTGIAMTDGAITTLGAEDGLTKKAVIESSRHTYIVMESEKFHYNDSYKYAHFDDISGIITDVVPDKSIVDALKAADVALF